MILVPIESAYATSYYSLIVTLVLLSCTVSEIRWLGWKWPFFPTLSYSEPTLPIFPLEFRGGINHEETRVMGLLCGESCMIHSELQPFLTDPPVWRTDGRTGRQTDGQTDRRTGDSIIARYSIQAYAVARYNCKRLMLVEFLADRTARRMIGYWHHVVCPSVRLSVCLWHYAWLNDTS